ncbi:MAG: flagellar biosynthesis repressor FlbT [Rhizobiales bacterium 65-9]|nr:flagellar biosynthesis repressor FlbT [Hyphomicrobiales bacterium]OJY34299.1 MAG: flagellar biosynthesis repressor FlbT [Rhizobiales bacterium 65-9]
MALKVELKPNERVIIGKAVIRNGETRARFFIEGAAPILREKDILTAQTATTPAKRIYLATQLMYLEGDVDAHHAVYFELVGDFMAAVPSALPIIAELNARILSGDLYKALRCARQLVAHEESIVERATSAAA